MNALGRFSIRTRLYFGTVFSLVLLVVIGVMGYVALYNHQLPQSALKSSTPMQAMKQWYQSHPHLFNKRPYDRPGCDT